MARKTRKTTAPRAAKQTKQGKPVTWGQLVLVVVFLTVLYFYQQGAFDRWLAPFGLEVNPTPVAVGGEDGPQVTLTKAVRLNGSWYELYFTRPTYPEQRSERTGGLEDALIADIDAAQSSVKIAVFEFNRPPVADALIRAKERGLDVRFVADSEGLADPEEAEIFGRLEDAGIPVVYEETDSFMHNKIYLFDERVVWTGSMNMTHTEVYRNNNNMIRTTVGPLVANYVHRFERLFGELGGTGDDGSRTPNPRIELENGVVIENYFSPEDKPRKRLVELINTAGASVHMLAFSFTDDDIAQAMIRAKERGLDVQLVMDGRSINGTGSEYGLMGEASIPAYVDGNCYTAHNKIIIVDNRYVVTGSYNFTNRAENVNDENLLIIDDAAMAQQYTDEFNRLLAEAQNPPRCGN